MSKIIGIDLGTTNSCVAVMEGGEPVVRLRNQPRSRVVILGHREKGVDERVLRPDYKKTPDGFLSSQVPLISSLSRSAAFRGLPTEPDKTSITACF